MLSQPFPFVYKIFLETNKSNKFSTISFFFIPIFMSEFTIYNKPELLVSYLYQIPSHPIKINVSFPSLLTTLMSGLEIMICSSKAIFSFSLYIKSPKALERFKFPLTLPSFTVPPAFVILFNSSAFSGL